jgi:hypothetical protein
MQALSLNISHALANAIATALQNRPTSLKGLTDGRSFEFGGLSVSQADSSQESQWPKHASRITSPTMIRHTLLPFEPRLHPLP